MSLTIVKYKEIILENIKIVVGLAGGLLLILFVVLPSFSSLPSLYAASSKRSVEMEVLNNRIKQINNLVSSQQSIKSSVSLVDRALPSKDDVPNLMNQIQSIATSSGVTLKALQFGGISKVEGAEYKRIALQAVLDGGFANISSLLSSLENTSRIINVNSISFDSQKGGGTGVLTVNLGLYAYFHEAAAAAGTPAPRAPKLIDLGAKSFTDTINYLKTLRPYDPQTVNVNVGKANPFE